MCAKLWKFLKFIYRSPLFLLMGIEGTPDAAASEAEGSDADQSGNLGEDADGLDTDSDEEDPDADQEEGEADETTDQEGEKPAEGEKKEGGIQQKSFEDRLKEIEEKNNANLARLKEEIQKEAEAKIAAATKPFVELTQEQSDKLNNDYVEAVSRIAELQEAIRLGDRDPQTITALRQAEKWIQDTEKWYAENEEKKAAWTAEQAKADTNATQMKERAERLETTANVFREAKGVPQDAWDAGSQWFHEQLGKDKILGLKFQDAYRRGDVEAVEFAYNYITENMGKEAAAVIEQKEEAKNKLPPGGGGGATTASETVMAQLRALHAQAQKDGSEESFAKFAAAKKKAGITGSIFAKAARK